LVDAGLHAHPTGEVVFATLERRVDAAVLARRARGRNAARSGACITQGRGGAGLHELPVSGVAALEPAAAALVAAVGAGGRIAARVVRVAVALAQALLHERETVLSGAANLELTRRGAAVLVGLANRWNAHAARGVTQRSARADALRVPALAVSS